MSTKYVTIIVAIVIAAVAISLAWWKITNGPKAPSNPLVGGWRQAQEKPCNGSWINDDRIQGLVFKPDGRFSLTFEPFCTYEDAWGTYAYDAQTGRLSLTLTGGNNSSIRDDFDGDGTAIVDLGERISNDVIRVDRLTLEGLGLGLGKHGKTCSLSFGRVGSKPPD
jgi:hypothetical protein